MNVSTSEPQEAVAIIGMAGRFPKARNLEEFWRNLRDGVECVSFFKDEEVGWLPVEHAPDLKDPRFVKARAVLEKPEWFDAAFFGMNPQEAKIMDPQHRVFLECAWEALEHAGCNPDTYPGLIGVFGGASQNSYLFANLLTNKNLIADQGVFSTMIANDGNFVPTRVSYKFNLRGPSINVQTACSTSLVAVCLAAQSLLSYRCDVALAGGVSISFPANRGQFHLEGGILSNDGHCRTFDEKALGTVLGDGAGIVVLKRLSEALADGDNICAVIKGTAINNDGAIKIGYTAPSIDGQAEAIAMAHSEAGFDPSTVTYVEAHGTGTPLGDPIEIAGLTKAFGLDGRRGQFCALGSVKSNIGHLDIGAGVAGLIKTVLALQHEQIPPSLHFERPNPKIDFANSPFFVNAKLRPWTRNGTPRRAGVSSFGIGGTNAHAALEEAPAPEPTSPAKAPQLLLLSAKTENALDAATENLAAHLEQYPQVNLADVAHTLQVGRKTFAHRRAVVANHPADAVLSLRAREVRRTVSGSSEDQGAPIAFLFPGQGAQAIDMARELYQTGADFRAQVDRSCEWLKPKLGLDLRQILFPAAGQEEAATKLLNETRITQPALFVIEHALAQMWMGWGIKPTAMIGHSLGEYVAACLAGVFSLEDALTLVAERARLMQAQPAGAMLAVRKPEQDVRGFLKNNLALAAVNAPGLCVVSGPFDEIEALEKKLSVSAIAFKRLTTSHAFHSPMMEGVVRPLAEVLRQLKLNAPKIPWVSNLTGRWITPAEATSAEYWTRHLRNTVRFADGVAELVKAGSRVLLEVGPGSTLGGLARQSTPGGAAAIVSTLGRVKDTKSDCAAVMLALGELWIAGAKIDWRDGIHAGERRGIVPLPTYPFERKRYIIEPGMSFDVGGSTVARAAGPAAPEVVGPNPDGPAGDAASGAENHQNGQGTLATLRALFQDLSGLDLTQASADASFYELGFDSLFLTQASVAIGRKFGVEITFRQLRDSVSSLAKLVALIDGQAVSRDDRPRQAPAATPAVPAEEKRLPLTDAQSEVWFASLLGEAASSAYNEASMLQLKGPMDAAALLRALRGLVARHEALRTTFAESGELQIIAPTGRIDLPLHDLSGGDAAGRSARQSAWIEGELQPAFDLSQGPLFRVGLLRVGPDNHILALVIHHIVCDGWSLGVLARELAELYSAEVGHRPTTLPAAPAFSEYAVRQKGVSETPAFRAAADYWKSQFADSVPLLELPTDRPRPAQRTYAGGFVLRSLSPEVTAAVKKLCAAHECTAFTALLATFNVLLHRLSGQDDVVVGVPSAAQVMDGVEHLVGHFANLLPMRSRLTEGRRFSEYLAEVRHNMTDALEHWRYPFGTLLQQLNLARDASRVPLAPVVFNTTRRRGMLHFAGLAAEIISNPKKFANFDLNFNFALTDDTISLGCYYSSELYDEATIVRWIGHFETLLRGVAANAEQIVGELPLMTGAERRQLLTEWNETELDYNRNARIHDLFEEQAKRTPEAIAMVGEHERVTYAELNRRAERLAERLRAAGVHADSLVGLFLERSPELLTGILGILKAGGAYVPLDPAYPKDRLDFIVGDTRMPVLVTQRKLLGQLPAGYMDVVVVDDDAAAPRRPVRNGHAHAVMPGAKSLAYVIYTSGSTGRPKGVCITHRGVVALVAWARQLYTPEELSGVLFATSASFDVSVFESIVPLCLGGKLILAENILGLPALAAVDEVRLISGVPSAVAELVRAHKMPTGVRTVNVAGEPCPQSLVESLYALPHIARVVDVYGPTETTVYSTGSIRQAGGRATIGRPLPNEQAYILDRREQPVPVGVRGELYLGGDKLARGYLNRDELTREKFVELPFLPGKRVYRTGDGARFLADGTIEFLGRLDHQVKIRGFRVELGEIETALAQHPTVGECVVLARPDPSGHNRLLAYVIPAPGASVEVALLRAHLQKGLPEYMVPSAILVLEKFPLTANGKRDRRALPDPEFGSAAPRRTPPRSTTEELLVEIWCDVLGIKAMGVEDNFFELGGHSLLATQVISRVQDTLNVELSMRQFFFAPTVAGMAPIIEEALIADIKAEAGRDVDAVDGKLLVSAKE